MNGPTNPNAGWFDKVVWTLLLGVTSFGVQTLRELTVNVNELNQKMAVMLERTTSHDKILDNHSQRIHQIEDKYRRAK